MAEETMEQRWARIDEEFAEARDTTPEGAALKAYLLEEHKKDRPGLPYARGMRSGAEAGEVARLENLVSDQTPSSKASAQKRAQEDAAGRRAQADADRY